MDDCPPRSDHFHRMSSNQIHIVLHLLSMGFFYPFYGNLYCEHPFFSGSLFLAIRSRCFFLFSILFRISSLLERIIPTILLIRHLVVQVYEVILRFMIIKFSRQISLKKSEASAGRLGTLRRVNHC